MNETCDRCGPAVRAVFRADRKAELYLCGHCARRLGQALSDQGWAVRPIGEAPPSRRGDGLLSVTAGSPFAYGVN
jgi:hypothetical protein